MHDIRRDRAQNVAMRVRFRLPVIVLGIASPFRRDTGSFYAWCPGFHSLRAEKVGTEL
jgi:hypothetical protein